MSNYIFNNILISTSTTSAVSVSWLTAMTDMTCANWFRD